MRAVAVIILFATAVTAAQGPRSEVRTAGAVDGLTVRVGYTAFEHPQTVSSDSTFHSIVRYLQHVSSQSREAPWRLPVGFEVSVGNYYQVFSWFRRGQVDAAIVSPFLAYLLERDGQALSVLEFMEHCHPGGHQPLVGASGAWNKAPWLGYDTYLTRLYEIARDDGPSSAIDDRIAGLRQIGRLNFVAHLSSSGFVLPVLYAEDWLRNRASPKTTEDSDEARRFWKLYFDLARFTLHHGVEAPEEALADLYFSYSGRAGSRLRSDSRKGGFVRWQPYDAGKTPQESEQAECDRGSALAPEIPNDVLIVRRSLLRELFGPGRIDRPALAAQLLGDATQMLSDAGWFADDSGYRGVRWFSDATHAAFRQRIDRIFSRTARNRELATRYARWFEHERFEFTVNETIGLLRLDQMNTRTSRLSLVLSGGGVKSLYQTRLLDRLYGLDGSHAALRNFDPAAAASIPLSPEAPMAVNSVIGTSGGAMVALFAAQLPGASSAPSTGERLPLTKLLGDTAAQRLFPPADLPRVVTIVVVLGLLFLTLSLSRVVIPSLRRRLDGMIVDKDCPWPIVIAEMLLVVGGTVAIVATRNPDMQTTRGLEGAMYAFLVVTAHLAICCIGRARGTPPEGHRRLAQLSTVGQAFGLAMAASAFAIYRYTGVSELAQHSAATATAPLMVTGGLCLASAALVTGAAAGMFGLRLDRQRLIDYGSALAVIAIVIAGTYAIVLAAAGAGQTTMLELTGSFWGWLIAAAAFVSVGTVAAATWGSGRASSFVQRGVHELMRDRQGAVTTTLASSVTFIATAALVCWAVIVAPSIYGSDRARQSLSETQARFTRAHQVASFNSNLVVTGSLLRDTFCPILRAPVRAGGLYFCFGGPAGCGAARDGAWQPLEQPHPARALNAVFASGSPFPVFAAQRTRLRNGCMVPVVDGGYVHNVPLEAASLSDSRQVLLLNASPSDLDVADGVGAGGTVSPASRWTSQLVQFGSRIIGFMFSRAQELDRTAGANMVVASLSPAPGDGRWAALLDFTEATRTWMVREAERDLERERRIGRIDSWGFPLVAARLSPDNEVTARGWTPEVRRVIAATGSARPGDVVALDMDNTILRGDIGDATFLKMVVELRYAGDRAEFWELFENRRAADELRRYWMQFTTARASGSAPPVYWNPENWTSDFADYVVLFHRQYEDLYNREGPERAYAWVVQLMDGMTREAVGSLVVELWNDEMRRSMTPVTIHSARYGDVEIQGGLRVHLEMRDLIDDLQRRGVQVWIVTASAEWVAHQVADALRVPRDRVIGVRSRPAGRFGEIEQPMPYGAGKALALRQRGLSPVLAIGDSGGDVEMLRLARAAVVIDRGRIASETIRAFAWRAQPIELLRTIAVP